MFNCRVVGARAFHFTRAVAVLSLVAARLYAAPQNSPSLQIEVPEAKLAPTTEPFINLPSADVQLILIHILSPDADGLDYGQIFPQVNGAAAARISETRPALNEIGR